MADKIHNTPAKIIKAIKGTGGIVSAICRNLSSDTKACSRATFHRYLKEIPEVAAAYNEERDEVGDLAENGLIAALEKEESWAIQYYLDCQGAHRGYGRRQNAVNINIKLGTPVEQMSTEELIEENRRIREEVASKGGK